ncbi:MAG: carboxypeptidase-like regulatory domain-containing protein [Gemmatimonadota bacterium]
MPGHAGSQAAPAFRRPARPRSRRRSVSGSISLLACVPVLLGPGRAPLYGQEVSGTVREAETGRAVEGAIVTLLGADGHEEDAVLTRPDGAFALRASAPGTFHLRVERIGLATWESEPMVLARDERRSVQIDAPVKPVQLPALGVLAKRQCKVDRKKGRVAALLWGEARKALRATSIGDRDESLLFRVQRFERRTDPNLEITDERSWREAARPFQSVSAQELARAGYVRDDGKSKDYYAPDAEALLSDTFLETHCFRLANPRREIGLAKLAHETYTRAESREVHEGLVGLGFEPVKGGGGSDVEGVLWLDSATTRLSHLDFHYTGLELGREVPTDYLGGRVDFDRLRSGAWIVRQWFIRMPLLARGWHRRRWVVFLNGYKMDGGVVLGTARETPDDDSKE